MSEFKIKLRKGDILAFAVKNKKKYGNLFTGTKGSYSDYFELMKIYVAEIGPGCEQLVAEGVGVGTECYISDHYELGTELPARAAAAYGPFMPFRDKILAEAREFSGNIEAFVINQDSIIGVEEPTCQTNPKLSLDPRNWETLSSAKTSSLLA